MKFLLVMVFVMINITLFLVILTVGTVANFRLRQALTRVLLFLMALPVISSVSNVFFIFANFIFTSLLKTLD